MKWNSNRSAELKVSGRAWIQARHLSSKRSKVALALGIGVPLAVIVAADPAAAQPESADVADNKTMRENAAAQKTELANEGKRNARESATFAKFSTANESRTLASSSSGTGNGGLDNNDVKMASIQTSPRTSVISVAVDEVDESRGFNVRGDAVEAAGTNGAPVARSESQSLLGPVSESPAYSGADNFDWDNPFGVEPHADPAAETAPELEPQPRSEPASKSGGATIADRTRHGSVTETATINAVIDSDAPEPVSRLEGLHITLDAAGLTPGAGVLPDVANGILYAFEGDFPNMAISAAAAVPVFGQAAGIARLGSKASTAVEKAHNGAERAERLKTISDANKTVAIAVPAAGAAYALTDGASVSSPAGFPDEQPGVDQVREPLFGRPAIVVEEPSHTGNSDLEVSGLPTTSGGYQPAVLGAAPIGQPLAEPDWRDSILLSGAGADGAVAPNDTVASNASEAGPSSAIGTSVVAVADPGQSVVPGETARRLSEEIAAETGVLHTEGRRGATTTATFDEGIRRDPTHPSLLGQLPEPTIDFVGLYPAVINSRLKDTPYSSYYVVDPTEGGVEVQDDTQVVTIVPGGVSGDQIRGRTFLSPHPTAVVDPASGQPDLRWLKEPWITVLNPNRYPVSIPLNEPAPNDPALEFARRAGENDFPLVDEKYMYRGSSRNRSAEAPFGRGFLARTQGSLLDNLDIYDGSGDTTIDVLESFDKDKAGYISFTDYPPHASVYGSRQETAPSIYAVRRPEAAIHIPTTDLLNLDLRILKLPETETNVAGGVERTEILGATYRNQETGLYDISILNPYAYPGLPELDQAEIERILTEARGRPPLGRSATGGAREK